MVITVWAFRSWGGVIASQLLVNPRKLKFAIRSENRLALLLLIEGCAAITPKGPPLTLAEIDRWFTESRVLVAEDSGLDLSQVSLSVATEAELIEEMKPTVRRALGREFSDSGLVARMTDSLVPAEVSSIVGLYSPEG